MSARIAIAAPERYTTPSRIASGAGHSRDALTSWLLGDRVQVASGIHAGAAAGWVDREGRASYVYPEITGYYLQWLAWYAACHGVNDETGRRAGAAQRWLLSWAFGAETPITRIYLEPAGPDWRNAALFFFDLAMVLRGLASADRLGLIDTDPRLVARVSELLWRLVADDGMFDACVSTRLDPTLPERWSTRRGPFLSKAAGGVLIAAAQFSSLPGALTEAADATFAAALESMSAQSHSETHALLYGIEGGLSLPEHPAAVAAMPHMVRQLRDLLERSTQLGHMPELLGGTGRVRLDIVAQAIRAAAFLLPELHVDEMARMLVHYIDPGLGIPFSPDVTPRQYNVWTAMFAEQALFAAECGPSDARWADLRLCLVSEVADLLQDFSSLEPAMSAARDQKRFAWGAGVRQRLRLTPLFLSLAIADRVGGALRTRTARLALPPWRAGLSIIIPERDSPQLLLRALASLHDALDAVDEPCQVVVVANGAARNAYDEVVAKYPLLEWVHYRRPLGFSAAIHKGLQRVRYDWTFLMNNDMTLDRLALREVCALRSAEVFAIACQIHQQSASGRREETGFTDWYVNAAGVQVFHADPGAEDNVRNHLCASGGAGLFRTAPLREYARDSRCYDPFYWEDVEWGFRAQQDGLSVLFCPGSHAWHQHRATSSRFYPPHEIERIAERNRILFDARNAITDHGAGWLMARVCDLSYDSQRGLARLPLAANVLRHRWRARRAHRPVSPPPLSEPHRSVTELVSSYSYKLGGAVRTQAAPTAQGVARPRPRVLIVTPFCVFPPRHGGARRIDGLLRELRRDFEIVLVTDEAALHHARSLAYFDGLHAVHFVQRPRDANGGSAADLGQRLRTHCHVSLVDAVEAALQRYRPDLVQIEHVELASLSRLRVPSQRWILGLHDAFSAADFDDRTEGDRLQQSVMKSYDAVTVCSAEDQAMISHPRVVNVPNGSAAVSAGYTPSMSFQLLFLGPFRYAQNLEGIRQFLSQAYPAIKAAEPAARLLILGGEQAPARISGDAVFAQRGVTVLEHREDVSALLSASVLTLNPLTGIRGSSVKVIESLAAGRACVSTEDGARGFIDAGFAGLVTTSNVSDMAGVVIELLRDPERRHRIEVPDAARLADYRWDRGAERQSALYRALLDSMASETRLSDTYDRIAQWYDVDMARNMRFDDVAFYADLCQREGGRVLELGCGNGRVLLELVCRNIDAVGVDTSHKMLQQLQHKAKARGLAPSACRMDARRLAFARSFDIVLCPYSLVTYMAQPSDLERMMSEVRQVLRADGLLVVDAFVPRDTVASDAYRLDYRRPFGNEVLARYKRVAPLTARINRIERRYEVVSTAGEVLQAVETSEDIQTFSPEELTEALLRSGFSQQQAWWDYGQASRDTDPQFFTVAARPTPAA